MLNAFCLCLLVLSDIITARAECSLSLTRWAMFPFINLFASLTGWYRVSMATDNCSRYQPKWWRLRERKGGKRRKNKHVSIDCHLELTVNTLNKHSSAHTKARMETRCVHPRKLLRPLFVLICLRNGHQMPRQFHHTLKTAMGKTISTDGLPFYQTAQSTFDLHSNLQDVTGLSMKL